MTDENKIAKYGSLKNYEKFRQHMVEIARKPRPNSKGGSFRNVEFAKAQGKIGGSRKRKLV